jgi:hypothetical protein
VLAEAGHARYVAGESIVAALTGVGYAGAAETGELAITGTRAANTATAVNTPTRRLKFESILPP